MADMKVVVIEDDEDVRLGCIQALELKGIAAEGVGSVEAAMPYVERDFAGVFVSDIRLPGRDGLSFLADVVKIDPALPVVLITGHGDVATAVKAMRDGAYDFVEKPFSTQLLVEVVRRALEKRVLALEVRGLRETLAVISGLESRIIGRSPGIAAVRRALSRIAASRADVLVRGETGTGKELIARCIHDLSGARGNFVPVNCGGLPETLFESEIFGHEAGAFTGATKRRVGKIEHAAGGTLFLDEIESMPIAMQIKLLRVLQERTVERLGSNQQIRVDFRVIAATKADLGEMSKAGRFRSDLYFRLNVATVELPPLRARREDVPLLFDHFIELAEGRNHLEAPPVSDSEIRALMAYDWPGNIREIRNVAERHVLGIDTTLGTSTPADPVPLAEAVDAFERTLIAEELRRQGGNALQTAKALGVAKSTLFDKIRKYDLDGK
ncbi:MAG: sigma-54 dependent transcriptional regulator [Ancalomicrobiaceae bacterium]|nr:sigma-54 dependent transcriptional regulator [Ancalomicrobiaceae bacterium]